MKNKIEREGIGRREVERDESEREGERGQRVPDRVLALQRSAGNRAAGAFVQTKLLVGPADDDYEREADAVADQVTGRRSPAATTAGTETGGFHAPNDLATYVNRGGGAPLPATVRRKLEPSFGLDFNDVRVHSDAKSAQMADSIGASAFTFGNDVYFGRGAYDPSSSSGTHLLAHELTHVVQQTGSAQRKIARKMNGANVSKRLASRRIQGNFLKKAKTAIRNLTGKSKEDKRAKTGEEETDTLSKPELQQYMARTKGGGPAENPDWSNPKFFGKEANKFKVKLAVAQEDSNWLKNAKDLRNAGLKMALSGKGRKELMSDGGKNAEKAVGKKVLEDRGDLEGLSETEINEKVKTFTKGIHHVGHTWVRLETYVGDELKDLYSYGMWPAKIQSVEDPEDEFGGYGSPHAPGQGEVRHPDNVHEGDAQKMYFTHEAKKAQFDKALKMAGERYASPPPYVLLGYNCTAFAREIFQAAGGSYPSNGTLLPGFAYTPGNLYHAVAKIAAEEEKKKKKPGKRTSAKEDEHKDIVKKITDKQQMLAESGVRDTQSEMFAVPKSDAKTSVGTFFAGSTFRYGYRPDFAEDNKITIDKDRQMTAVDNPAARDRWDVVTFWLGPKKYMYVPTEDAEEAGTSPEEKKENAKKKLEAGLRLALYNGQGGGFKKPLPTDPVVREFERADAAMLRITEEDGEWVNVNHLRSGDFFWCKKSHLLYVQDPEKNPRPLDFAATTATTGGTGGTVDTPSEPEEEDRIEATKDQIPLYNQMDLDQSPVHALPTKTIDNEMLEFDYVKPGWFNVYIASWGGDSYYVSEADWLTWKSLNGRK